MINGVHDLPPEFLQIKQDDKFFSRLLSKERSKAGESSFRVLYYGGAGGSIPFTWESQPGTPKHPFADNSIPPLTPPPSYQLSPRSRAMRRYSKHNFLGSFLARTNSRKSDDDKLASFSSSSSSSSHSSLASTPVKKHSSRKNEAMTRSMSADHDNHEIDASPTSVLCFGAGIKFGGSHRMKNVMKRAFLSMGRHGTA